VGKLAETLKLTRAEALKPPPRLTLSGWADLYAYLSPETSAEAGKFMAFGYQNGIMDAITDPTVKQVTVMKSARVGYTKILDHAVGYFIHQDPSPILIVQPRVEDAEDYSRTEIVPMLRDTPVLAEIAGDLKAKDANQRILKRVFRNGASISFVGANSPGGFRRITARVVAFDEVDGYPVGGAGDEGDQISLGTKRTESFWNRKIILGSTPTIKGLSRIEKSWTDSDQRRFHVPCPSCGHMQVLKWQNLTWNKDHDDRGKTVKHYPETAHFICEAKGCIIEEHEKPAMINAGVWVAEKNFVGHAGFHIWAGYSLFPNAAWRYLVEEFLRVRKDPALLKTFVNLVLGETWEDEGEKADAGSLINRGEAYDHRTLPDHVIALTAGVDVQGDRLEVQVIAWGVGEESWPCLYEVLHGDPAQGKVWDELDTVLLETYQTDAGRSLRIKSACIDTGYHTASVFSFCRNRRTRRVFAVKGQSGSRPIWPKRGSKSKTNDIVFMIGVDTAKEAIYGRLRAQHPGPGYVHFPREAAFDEEYFAQLTAEQVVTRYREGRPYRVWVPMRPRNEVLDTFVYALAALRALSIRLDGRKVKTGSAESQESNEPIARVSDEREDPPPYHAPMAIPPKVTRQKKRSPWLKVKRGWL
jgi:phage terminase large subunit GpA-like protein